MKSMILILSVFFSLINLAAAAPKARQLKGEAIEMLSRSGSIILINQKKMEKEISDFSKVRVDLVGPGFLKIFKAIAGHKKLILYIGEDQYSFSITGDSFNARREFSTHKQYTGQNYHIQMKKEVKDYTSLISDKRVSCTYSDTCWTTRSVTDSNGNSTLESGWESCTSYGTQRARVDDQSWLERDNYTIYNGNNQVNFRTLYTRKEDQQIIKTLTSCQ